LSYTESSSTEIAEYLGFSGESHFSALFTKQEGVSPKEFRRREYQKHFELNISGITQRDLQKKG
ncbi:MAG: helix-turn-helix transcriptional regulator, partial [Lachnospiraceae bacterium]|nr:helix-turn-helix transcriptional regulator [Lachnospiraceae bacterium]